MGEPPLLLAGAGMLALVAPLLPFIELVLGDNDVLPASLRYAATHDITQGSLVASGAAIGDGVLAGTAGELPPDTCCPAPDKRAVSSDGAGAVDAGGAATVEPVEGSPVDGAGSGAGTGSGLWTGSST